MRFSLIRRCRRFDPSKMFDESPEELDKMRRRYELRQKLKTEFNRFYYNPYNSAYGVAYVDPQFERYYAARFYRLEYWKPTFGTFIHFVATLIIPFLILNRFFQNEEDRYWNKTQSGELTYLNRKIYCFLY